MCDRVMCLPDWVLDRRSEERGGEERRGLAEMTDGEAAARKGMRKLRKAVFGTVNELRPATHGHNLSVKVGG